MERVYEVVLEPAEEGGFTVFAPGLRGCVSEGETVEEALENIKRRHRRLARHVGADRREAGSMLRTVVVSR